VRSPEVSKVRQGTWAHQNPSAPVILRLPVLQLSIVITSHPIPSASVLSYSGNHSMHCGVNETIQGIQSTSLQLRQSQAGMLLVSPHEPQAPKLLLPLLRMSSGSVRQSFLHPLSTNQPIAAYGLSFLSPDFGTHPGVPYGVFR
jgi:hypothetical protein